MASLDKLYILTGATGAIGQALAEMLAAELSSLPATGRLLLACRNPQKGNSLSLQLQQKYPDCIVETAHLDLADEESVKQLARLPLTDATEITLINNAGIMCRNYSTDAKGRELSLAVNYHNTRLLTELLLQTHCLHKAIFTTSLTRFFYKPFSRNPQVTPDTFHQLRTYGLSKRLITDYAATLHNSAQCQVACGDPGIVNSSMIAMKRWYDPLADIFFRPFIRSPHKGALPTWRAIKSETGYIYTLHTRYPLPKTN